MITIQTTTLFLFGCFLNACTGADCGGVLTNPFGVITSPNYPSNYNNNMQCTWDIKAPEGYHINVNFRDFALEYLCYDYLELFNGPNAPSPSFGKFCGTAPPRGFQSQSNYARIVFSTDSGVSARGFNLTYTFSKEDSTDTRRCPQDLVRTAYLRSHGSKCYYFERSETNWSNAQAQCQRSGGNLITITRQDIQLFVEGVLRELWTKNSMWIGAHDRHDEMDWYWINGVKALHGGNYENWDSGQPQWAYLFFEDCGALRTDEGYKWHDYNCNYKYGFACEYDMIPIPPTTRAPTTRAPTTLAPITRAPTTTTATTKAAKPTSLASLPAISSEAMTHSFFKVQGPPPYKWLWLQPVTGTNLPYILMTSQWIIAH